MYGPPGTGKTLLARACAAQTNACFLKLGATALVQMFIGDGARLVRDAFALAKEKQPTIIFIDELGKIIDFHLIRIIKSMIIKLTLRSRTDVYKDKSIQNWSCLKNFNYYRLNIFFCS